MNEPSEVSFKPAQTYTLQQWEQKRGLITRLYHDEAKTLHQVRIALAQEAFRPTEAMLKKRIKKWDLDRKLKEADALYALALAWEREKQGKKTNFMIRGRLVTFAEIKLYFRRKGIRDLRSLQVNASSADPTTRIGCQTPEPSATAPPQNVTALSADGSSHDIGYPADQHVIVLPDQPQLDHSMSLLDPLHDLDHILHLNRNHFDAIIEGSDWKTESAMFEMKSLEQFYHHMIDGQSLVESGFVSEGFKSFNQAFDLVRSLLRNRTILFMPYIYHFLTTDENINLQTIQSQLLSFVADMVMESHSSMTPIHHSMTLLKHLPFTERAESSKRALRYILDRLKTFFGRTMTRPTEAEICSDIVCHHGQGELAPEVDISNYKMTAIAVWKLDDDISSVSKMDAKVCVTTIPLQICNWKRHETEKHRPYMHWAPSGLGVGRPTSYSSPFTNGQPDGIHRPATLTRESLERLDRDLNASANRVAPKRHYRSW